MSQRAKAIGAALLLGLLAVLLMFQARDDRKAAATAERRAGSRAKQDDAAHVADAIPVVAALAFRPVSREVFTRERSLFAYALSPAVVAKMEADRIAAEKLVEQQRIEDEKQAKIAKEARDKQDAIDREEARKRAEAKRILDASLPPPKPVPPDFPFEFVGLIGPKENLYAILLDRAKKLHYVQAGTEIESAFRIEFVGRHVIDVSYLDSRFQDQFKRVQKVTKPGLDVSASAPAATAKPARRR